jgi:hypothetical protein
LYTENDLDQVMAKLEVRLKNEVRVLYPEKAEFCECKPKSFKSFRAVIWVRFHGDPTGLTPEMPVPLGFAIDPRGEGHILKMGGVCKRWFGRYYGLQIFIFP